MDPSIRLLVCGAGLGLTLYGLTQRFPTACVLGTVGLGLLASAFSGQELKAGPGQGPAASRERTSQERRIRGIAQQHFANEPARS